jgi:sigma-B regulation protein RsbU (phosphoserine phosphatase)
LAAVNHHLLADIQANQFVTVFLAVLDRETGRLVYANAGHWPPILVGASPGETVELRRTGMPLGIEMDAAWEEKEVLLGPGDVLVLYTDGINEAESPDGKFFGIPRLERTIQGLVGESAMGILEGILADVLGFTGKERGDDDIALVVVRRG